MSGFVNSIGANTSGVPYFSSTGLPGGTGSISKGTLLAGNNSTTPALVAVGADGTFLQASAGNTGGLTWSAPAAGVGGPWKFITSLTASNSATLDFTTGIDSTYYMYAFVIENVYPASNSAQLSVRLSANGGSSWDTSSVYTSAGYQSAEVGPTLSAFSSPNADSWTLTDTMPNTGINLAASGVVYIINPSGTQFTKGSWSICHDDAVTTAFQSIAGNLIHETAAAYNAVRFLMNTGNITGGIIKCYGCCTPS